MGWPGMAAAPLVAWATLAGIAEARLKICNGTAEMQAVALGFKGQTDWSSRGWWNIAPGDCATVVAGDLIKRYYYYHADSPSGGFRGQDYFFCTRDDAFDITGDTDCEARGLRKTEFREIDTGETARDFTLTLTGAGTESRADVSSIASTPKAPGGTVAPEPEAGTLGTQSVTEAPRNDDVTVDLAALQTDLPAGRHGAPFRLRALFQGCELEEGRAYCGFHADGVKLRAYYEGPTPEDMLFALEELPVNTPVDLDGDQVERRGDQRAVVLRSVRPRAAGDDPHAAIRAALQGDWVSAADPMSEITILGSEIHVRHAGAYKTTRFLRIADRCEGSDGAGPVLIQSKLGGGDARCYVIERADSRLDLRPVKGGGALAFRRP